MKSHPAYECVGVVGRGKLATVYRARDLALKREVAIKELTDEARRDERLLQRFWDEARFLANVEHDNVVQIYGLDQERGWVIMELAASGLDASTAREPLSPTVVRGVLRQVLDGLDCLHQQGRVHGGIKPANLLVTAQGTIKISDSTGLSGGPAAAAPAKYLAPEQLDPAFGPTGPGVDLYCLGFTALELLIGPSFDSLFSDSGSGGADGSLGWRRLHGSRSQALPAAATVVADLPADLARVIDRLVQKDVAARYATAVDALKDLEDEQSPPVPAAPSPATLPPGAARVVPPPAPGNPPTVRVPVAAGTGGPGAGHETLLPTMFPVLQQPGERNAPFPPGLPAAAGGTPRQPALETVRDTPRYPRWSRRWINQKLENPRVLYPICGTIAFVTVLLLADLFMNRPVDPPRATLRAVAITSSPDGAAVDIDGERMAERTNASFQLKPGRHTVRVELTGYVAAAQTIDVPADGPAPPPFNFELVKAAETTTTTTTADPPTTGKKPYVPVPAVGKLQVRSDPEKATVFVDGKDRGTTPVDVTDLSPGPHTVRVERPLYKAWTDSATIKAGEQSSISRMLEPLRPPGRFALLVGVRQAAEGLPVFRHAAADMAELGRTLQAAGYGKGNVSVLSQVADGGADAAPTAKRVQEAIRALVKDRYPADTLLLALDGPAVTLPGGGSYFCPASADPAKSDTLVSLEWVFQQLAECPAATKVVLLDGNRVGPTFPTRPEAAKVEDLVRPGVTLLAATTGGSPGYVHADARHGAFWHFVLRGLRGGDEAGGAPEVTVGGLARYVTERTRAYVGEAYKATRGEQTPVLAPPSDKVASAVLARPEPALLALQQGDRQREDGDRLRDRNEDAQAKAAFNKAAESYGQAIAERNDLVEAYLGRAAVRYRLGNHEGTAADCARALQLDPADAAAYDMRGDSHQAVATASDVLKDMNLGEMDLAIQDYSKAIALDPDYAPFLGSRGVAYSSIAQMYDTRKERDKAKAEYERAVNDFTKAIRELSPTPRWVYFRNRARAYRRLGLTEQAVNDYTAALQTGERPGPSTQFFLYYNRGLALYALKEYARAEADFSKSIELNPNDADAHGSRADALAKLGRKEESQKELDKGKALKRPGPANTN